MSSATIILTLLSLVPCHADEKGGIDARLFFLGSNRDISNGSLYDPTRSDPRSIVLQVVNRSGQSIVLPGGYDGKVLRLCARPVYESGYPKFPLLLLLREKKPTGTINVDAEQYINVLSLPLDEVLKLEEPDKNSKSTPKWGWTCERPAPIVKPRPEELDEFVPSRMFWSEPVVVFWAEVMVDKQIVRTPPLLLMVRQPSTPIPPAKRIPQRP
jgi:hypothetical protein